MADRERLERILRDHALSDFKWIDPKTIVVPEREARLAWSARTNVALKSSPILQT